MEVWTRDDGRFYTVEVGEDLFGLAVLVTYGGQHVTRWRTLPVGGQDEAERTRAKIAKTRAAHGYRLTP